MVNAISRGYQKWSWLEKYTYFCFWKRKGHLKYPSNKILNKVSPQIFFTVQDKMDFYTQLMQSVIFKVESVSPVQKNKNLLLLSRLLAAPTCDCLGKPKEQSHTVIPKQIIRKWKCRCTRAKEITLVTLRGIVTNRNRHELFSSMQ